MVISIASGKGGTGKTTVAVNLARIWREAGRTVRLMDCDVEAPNGHLFLNPTIERCEPVAVRVPVVEQAKCNMCGACSKLCQYGAIVCLGDRVFVYPELCRSCGGCAIVCKEKAITETLRETGEIEIGRSDGVAFVQGRLNVGEAMAVPVIEAVKERKADEEILLLDAPPGTSCPMMATIKGTDFVCLVTEPTPFGLNDLQMAVEALWEVGLSSGVVINRSDIGDDRVKKYCESQRIPILAEIPNDRRVAEAYSRGAMIVEAVPEMRAVFEGLATAIEEQVCKLAN